jgi:RES domain-containing protein
MRLWRISMHTTLADACFQQEAGRWHFTGRSLLYLSATPELAMLEALVHHRIGMDHYFLTSVAVPARARIRTLADADLPRDWRHRKPWSRALGEAWLVEGRVPVLSVPSAVCPVSRNYLLNPAHPSLRRLRLAVHSPVRFDRRLLVRRELLPRHV